MDFEIGLWLAQDGLTNGAIYALLALAMLLVFAVTRVIFVPQGDLIAYTAMSLAMAQAGDVPKIGYVLLGGGAIAFLMDLAVAARQRRIATLWSAAVGYVLIPVALVALAHAVLPMNLSPVLKAVVVMSLIVPMGPVVYRIAYQPLANTSVMVLFMASIAVHLILQGLGLIVFGGEGVRATPLSDGQLAVGGMLFSAQSLLTIAASLGVMLMLWLFMEKTIYGQALRATAFNRVGARLVGVRPKLSGSLSMLLASTIAAVSGVLIASLSTIYYDSGFLIGIKGFIGAILGGLVSFPLAAVGAIALGLVESFASFFSSKFKESLVFALIIPALIWLSFKHRHVNEEEDEA